VRLDFINPLGTRGLGLEQAVLKGASTSLRAISLTSLTTIGWSMIFGLTGSTLLTPIVQPVAYASLEARKLACMERRVARAGSPFEVPTT
jgi:multidrug efflux pump subunit AcrB